MSLLLAMLGLSARIAMDIVAKAKTQRLLLDYVWGQRHLADLDLDLPSEEHPQ
jgi:hypothetical protein